jgi:DNA topoisomerase-1
MKDLIIVESPTKARTIKKILKGGKAVISSKGHIRDLPKSRLGVEIKDGKFYPEYINIRGKAADIKEIQKAAKKAKRVFLAPDPDREGEAIAQHLAEVITHSDIVRIRFFEITKNGIRKALENPGEIDHLLVDAHKTRRVLDRLVGYKVSPLLWKMVRRGLSAGRVQTVALRILVEREKEIEAFKPEPYWTVKGLFEARGERFEAELVRIDGKKAERLNKEQMKKANQRRAHLHPFSPVQDLHPAAGGLDGLAVRPAQNHAHSAGFIRRRYPGTHHRGTHHLHAYRQPADSAGVHHRHQRPHHRNHGRRVFKAKSVQG